MNASFRPGSAFGTKRRERTSDGELIIREGSSEYFSEETYEQRFYRVLRRQEFNNLRSFLSIVQFTDREQLRFLFKYDGCASLMGESILALRIIEKMPDHPASKDFQSFVGLWDPTSGLHSAIATSETEMEQVLEGGDGEEIGFPCT